MKQLKLEIMEKKCQLFSLIKLTKNYCYGSLVHQERNRYPTATQIQYANKSGKFKTRKILLPFVDTLHSCLSCKAHLPSDDKVLITFKTKEN